MFFSLLNVRNLKKPNNKFNRETAIEFEWLNSGSVSITTRSKQYIHSRAHAIFGKNSCYLETDSGRIHDFSEEYIQSYLALLSMIDTK